MTRSRFYFLFSRLRRRRHRRLPAFHSFNSNAIFMFFFGDGLRYVSVCLCACASDVSYLGQVNPIKKHDVSKCRCRRCLCIIFGSRCCRLCRGTVSNLRNVSYKFVYEKRDVSTPELYALKGKTC